VAAELPADAVDGRVGAEVSEEAVPVERQRRGRAPPRVLGGRPARRVRHVVGRRRGPPSFARGPAGAVAGLELLGEGGREDGVLEQRVVLAPGGAALRRAPEEEEVLEAPLLAPAPAPSRPGRRRGGREELVVAAPERGQRPRGPPAPRRGGRGGVAGGGPASFQRLRRRFLTLTPTPPPRPAAGPSRRPREAIGRGGGGVFGCRNARARRVERPDPAALEELVGGGEDRRGLPQLPAEPEREVELRGAVARGGVPGGVAGAGRAGRGAGEEVAAVAREVVAGGGSRAARCAWRHDHLHRHRTC
jgi:hypothetical protein